VEIVVSLICDQLMRRGNLEKLRSILQFIGVSIAVCKRAHYGRCKCFGPSGWFGCFRYQNRDEEYELFQSDRQGDREGEPPSDRADRGGRYYPSGNKTLG
jgi:hypothetical protein